MGFDWIFICFSFDYRTGGRDRNATDDDDNGSYNDYDGDIASSVVLAMSVLFIKIHACSIIMNACLFVGVKEYL